MNTIDWPAISAIATAISTPLLFGTLIYAWWQFKEINRSRKLTAMTTWIDRFLSEDSTKARAFVMGSFQEPITRKQIEELELKNHLNRSLPLITYVNLRFSFKEGRNSILLKLGAICSPPY